MGGKSWTEEDERATAADEEGEMVFTVPHDESGESMLHMSLETAALARALRQLAEDVRQSSLADEADAQAEAVQPATTALPSVADVIDMEAEAALRLGRMHAEDLAVDASIRRAPTITIAMASSGWSGVDDAGNVVDNGGAPAVDLKVLAACVGELECSLVAVAREHRAHSAALDIALRLQREALEADFVLTNVRAARTRAAREASMNESSSRARRQRGFRVLQELSRYAPTNLR